MNNTNDRFEEGASEDLAYAGFWRRLGAFILDHIIFNFIAGILMVVLMLVGLVSVASLATVSSTGAAGAGMLVSAMPILITFVYFVVLPATKLQATPGKIISGVKIVTKTGAPISIWRSLARVLSTILSALLLGLGYLIIAFNSEKKGLHDMIAGTRVVVKRKSRFWPVFIVFLLLCVGLVFISDTVVNEYLMPHIQKEMMKGFQQMPGGNAQFDEAALNKMREDLQKLEMQTQELQQQTATLNANPAPTVEAPPPVAQPIQLEEKIVAGSPVLPYSISEEQYQQLISTRRISMEGANTENFGPVSIQLDETFGEEEAPFVTINVQVDPYLNMEKDRGGMVLVNIDHVFNSKNDDVYDREHRKESLLFKDIFLSKAPEGVMKGARKVTLKSGTTKEEIRKIQGRVVLRLPIGIELFEFQAGEQGVQKPVSSGGALMLKGMSGSEVRMTFKGPKEMLLNVIAYNQSANALERSSKSAFSMGDESEFTYSFYGTPARIQAVVATRFMEKEYPFTIDVVR